MIAKENLIKELGWTVNENGVFVHDFGEEILCLYSSTENDLVTFFDRNGKKHVYPLDTYGKDWKCFPIDFRDLTAWDDVAPIIAKAFHAEYDDDEILTLTEDEADRIANLMESLGFPAVCTGYYDPEDDARDGINNNYTGKWYVTTF